MLFKALGGAGIDKTWTDIEDISPRLVRAVIASEDQRFCSHHGIDWVEVQNALDDEDGRFRGASTITMQTVKNLFLWTGRSWVRKALEAPLALYAELFLSKRRIMEIYLNIVEWDVGRLRRRRPRRSTISACRRQSSPPTQAARLAAVLPSPDDARRGQAGARARRGIARRIAARDGAPGKPTPPASANSARDGWPNAARRLYIARANRSAGPLARRSAPISLWSLRCLFQNEKPRA